MLYKLKDKITVMIPSYNSSEYIGELLDDIANQYYTAGMTIVIADLGSDDDTIDIINKKKEEIKDLDIQVFENKSLDDLRQIALRSCDTPYILFIEPDTKLFSKWVLINSTIWLHRKNTQVASVELKSYNSSKSYLYKLLLFTNKMIQRVIQSLDSSASNSYFCVSYDDFLHFGRFNGMNVFNFSDAFEPTDVKITRDSAVGSMERFNERGRWKDSIMEFTKIKKDSSEKEVAE